MAEPSSTSELRSRFYARAFGIVAASLLAWGLYQILSPFFMAGLWATLITYMLQPLNNRLNAKWKRPSLSASLLTAGTALVALGPVSIFVFAFVRQATDLLTRFQTEAHERKLPFLQLVLEFRPVAALLDVASTYANLTKEQILEKATEATQQLLQRLASLGGSVVVGAFQTVTLFGLTLFLLFFFLRDGKQMVARMVSLIPLSDVRKDDLGRSLGAVARAVVVGTAVTALVQGTLLGIGWRIAGLPSPLVFGALGALVSLIPVVGTTLLWVPAAVTLYAQGETGMAVFLVVWCVVLVAGSDNVIKPLIISGSSNASTLLVLIGVLGGLSAFGFAGIFMGPLILTLAAALVRYADESRVGRLTLFVSSSGASEPVPARAIITDAKEPAPEPSAPSPDKAAPT